MAKSTPPGQSRWISATEVGRARVEGVRRPHLAGERQLVVGFTSTAIIGDAAGDRRPGDRTEADAAGAEDRQALARPRLRGVEDRAEARRDRTAEQRGLAGRAVSAGMTVRRFSLRTAWRLNVVIGAGVHLAAVPVVRPVPARRRPTP